MENRGNIKKSAWEGYLLWLLYIAFIIASVAVCARILYLQKYFIDSDPYIRKYYMTKSTRQPIQPRRGDIISSEGRLLATSIPMYQIFMDCEKAGVHRLWADEGPREGRSQGE